MTIDIIRQARERLEALKAESTQGVWEALGITIETDQEPWEVLSSEVNCLSYCYGGSAKGLRGEDAELIVTLHRTIDAQIQILKNGERVQETLNGYAYEIAEALAKAMMGVE